MMVVIFFIYNRIFILILVIVINVFVFIFFYVFLFFVLVDNKKVVSFFINLYNDFIMLILFLFILILLFCILFFVNLKVIYRCEF